MLKHIYQKKNNIGANIPNLIHPGIGVKQVKLSLYTLIYTIFFETRFIYFLYFFFIHFFIHFNLK
jgi:hypothetical protein